MHLTNQYRGADWNVRFSFFDETEPGSGIPDPLAPTDLSGSTWVMTAWPIDDPDAVAFATFDIDSANQADGYIDVSLAAANTGDAVVGADCAATYVYQLVQTRAGQTIVSLIGTIQVTDVRVSLAAP